MIERLLLPRRVLVLQLLYAIENLAQIARRIDGQLVAHIDVQLARKFDPNHGRVALQVQLPALDELAQGNHFFFLFQFHSANQWRQATPVELDNHRPLHIRRGRDHARRVPNLHRQVTPVAQDILRRDQNVRVELHHLLSQLAIETSHDRDNQDEYRHAQGHPQNGDERDDGNKRPLRFEVTEREEEAER